MDWIKRNLLFVIGAVVALVLLGAAGWYSYSGFSNNNTQAEELLKQYEELKRLKQLKPAPGEGKVDNIKLAREQVKEAEAFGRKLTQRLAPIPALPPGTNLSAQDYSTALQRTIDDLQHDATNNSVILPPKYKFSFEAQAGRVTFAPGSLEPLAAQLGEVKAICEILNAAKINSLDGLRRVRVSADDSSGPATDYLESSGLTNDLAILVPYEVSVRCFTPELAAMLAGFGNTPYGLIVKGVNVEPAAVVLTSEAMTPMAPIPVPTAVPDPARQRYSEGEAFRNRYGPRPTAPMPAPQPVLVPLPAGAAPKTGMQPFLTEKQLKVTLLIHVVKLLPQK